jgi:hypothetical protein
MQEVEEKPNFDTELSEENEYDYSVWLGKPELSSHEPEWESKRSVISKQFLLDAVLCTGEQFVKSFSLTSIGGTRIRFRFRERKQTYSIIAVSRTNQNWQCTGYSNCWHWSGPTGTTHQGLTFLLLGRHQNNWKKYMNYDVNSTE